MENHSETQDLRDSLSKEMTSLYIHMPFCKNRCFFCSFVVAIGKQNYIDAYLEGLAKEAGGYRDTFLKTIYVGGGTPSFINQEQLKRLTRIIRENFRFAKDAEFTIEANPDDIHYEKAKLLHELGVNRVSLGAQSLNDRYLKFLGRAHNSQQVLGAFSNLRKAGFTNINLDLMFSFPGQTLAEIKADAKGITALGSEHLSLYTLTIEKESKFYKQNIKLDSDLCQADQYLLVVKILEESGFHQYEVSNFAKPQKESQHNCVYWQGGNYIGLGVGAHSHKNGERFWNTSNINIYLAKINENIKPIEGREKLNPQERLMETLLFGLRMKQGVEIGKLEESFNEALTGQKRNIINQFVKGGFLFYDGPRLKTTTRGRLLLDELSSRLI